jgi:hypothetical protein
VLAQAELLCAECVLKLKCQAFYLLTLTWMVVGLVKGRNVSATAREEHTRLGVVRGEVEQVGGVPRLGTLRRTTAASGGLAQRTMRKSAKIPTLSAAKESPAIKPPPTNDMVLMSAGSASVAPTAFGRLRCRRSWIVS